MTDLTPESEYLVATIDEDTTLDELRSHLAAIEAAAIARDREGLVERVAQYIPGRVMKMFTWADCDEATREQYRAEARRLLALDAPEAQCRCGHAQRVHVTDVDWDEHSGCTSTGCDCRLFAIPEAQEADR
jgi:hypothetical protein